MAQVKIASNDDQALIRAWHERLKHRRWLQERGWWGNILFYLGQQWVIYDSSARRWRQRKLSPSVPTPITNLFRATIDTVKSAIAQHEPRFLGLPTLDAAEAVARAAAVDAQLRVIFREAGFKAARLEMLDWLLLTGNAFHEIAWEEGEETGVDQVPLEQCQDCFSTWKPGDIKPNDPVCPNCASPYLVDSPDQMVEVPRGEMRYMTLSPFEVFLDPVITDIEQQPAILLLQSYTTEQIKSIWDKDVQDEGFGGYGEVSSSAIHRDSIASVAPGVTPGSPYAHSTGGDTGSKRVLVFRLFVKACKEYPNGLYLAMTNRGEELEKVKPFPWRKRNGKGRKYYPLVHYRFGTVTGRAWGFTPADDLTPKQYQLNKAESLFTLIMTRVANPVWLIPANSNPSRISGEIGIQIEYTPVGGAQPQRVPGAEAPQSLVKYIEDIRQSFDELSGAFAAVRGRSMGSRTPVGTVQSLQERGFGRWATVFQGIEAGYESRAKKSLEVWRMKAHTPRLMAVRDAVGGFSFQEFIGADWDEGVEVEVEAGSTRPHTQTEKMQTYMELAQVGVLDFMDEAQKIKMMEDIGMLNMRPGVEEDTKHAYKENAQFLEWARGVGDQIEEVPPEMVDVLAQQLAVTMPIHVVPTVVYHALHFLTHRRLAMTDEFKQLPMIIQQAWYMHMMQHQADLMASKVLNAPPMALRNAGVAASMGGAQPGGQGNGSPAQASTREMGGGESNPNAEVNN